MGEPGIDLYTEERMYPSFQQQTFYPFVIHAAGALVFLVLLELILKGFALWRAGRNNQSWWFIALLVLNTVGILPLIYLLFFQRRVVEVVESPFMMKTQTSTHSPRSRSRAGKR
jgi:hypothetical protein